MLIILFLGQDENHKDRLGPVKLGMARLHRLDLIR